METLDPIESENLANPQFATIESRITQSVLAMLLEEQCRLKRKYPTSGNVPGKYSCEGCVSKFRV